MFSTIWHTFFFDPIYNALIFLIDIVPHGDVGIAIVLVIIIVKIVLFPLSIKAAKTQKLVKEIDPKIKEIKKTITDPQEQAKATMALYKDSGMNPFSSILLMFIQIPVIIALYFAVSRGGGIVLPEINTALLYSFVPQPETISMMFLGLIDITQKSIPLAIIAGLAQFVLGYFTFPKLEPKDPDAKPTLKDDFARSMQVQMKYVMPFMIGIFAYSISAMIGLYFIVGGVTSIIQELLIRKHKV